ncbi:MAG: hypothetical protein QMD21_04775 [Candidatus Thermoplasmatota archaeon]|nr:hypothetical protein [Candidatus Thermoplasmatota archaeon]
MKEAFLSLFGKEKETLQGKKEKREREKNPMFFFSREGLFFFLKRKGLQGKREKSRKKGRKP